MPELDPDEMLEEITQATPAGKTQITKIRYTHDAMIDLIVANPRITQNQIAAQFGYTPAWISTVMATDLFRERLAERRMELVDPAVSASINERFKALVFRSAEVLMEKLSAPVSQIPDNLALRAAELGARGAALGGFAAHAAPVAPPPPADSLSLIADRLLALQGNIRAQRTLNAEDATIVREG